MDHLFNKLFNLVVTKYSFVLLSPEGVNQRLVFGPNPIDNDIALSNCGIFTMLILVAD